MSIRFPSTSLLCSVLSLAWLSMISAHGIGGDHDHDHDDTHDHQHHHHQDTCTETTTAVPYDMPLHIATVFILFAVSSLAALIPIMSTRFSLLRKVVCPSVLSMARFFGAGVILSTVYIHMLLPAEKAFGSPCIPEGFRKYAGLGGVFAIVGIISMVILDVAINTHRNNKNILSETRSTSDDTFVSPADNSIKTLENGVVNSVNCLPTTHHHNHGCGEDLLLSMVTGEELQTRKIALYSLEVTIAVHSVLVGLMLGLERGDNFFKMMIAVLFHQFFEGLALGAVAVPLNLRAKALVALTLIFALTTTFGCALGVIISSSMIPNRKNPTAIVTCAILEALCAGILTYTALVDVLMPELRDKCFYKISFLRRMLSLLCFIAGAAIMAFIGRWA